MAGRNLSRIPIPPQDCISGIEFSPDPASSNMAVVSWDCRCYVYHAASGSLQYKYTGNFPITDVAWMDPSRVILPTLDSKIGVLDTITGQLTNNFDKCHESVVRKVKKIDDFTIISGGWDKKVKMWDLRTGKNVATSFVGAKVFCMDLNQRHIQTGTSARLVVGGSDKKLHVYDFRNSLNKMDELESTLKYQLRSLACFPDGKGYIQGSVEGRASWEYFDSNDGKKFAFKCHRTNPEDGVEQIHPVHDIKFHPIYGTFATVGGDGTMCMWDATVKKRIWKTSAFDDEIVSVGFSANGKYMAMGVSGIDKGSEGPKEIWIKQLSDEEVQSRKPNH